MARPKLLLDENIALAVVLRLRKDGCDAESIIEHSPGMKDSQVLRKARLENRIVITLDQDFGALIFRDSNKHVGVLFLRPKKESAENIYNLITRILNQYGSKLINKFTVASESSIRIKA